MPIYMWTSDSGKTIEREYRMSDRRPNFILRSPRGTTRDVFDDDLNPESVPEGWVVFRRDWSIPIHVNDMSHAYQYPYRSFHLRGFLTKDDAPMDTVKIPMKSRKGFATITDVPVILSRKHELELQAKYKGKLGRV